MVKEAAINYRLLWAGALWARSVLHRSSGKNASCAQVHSIELDFSVRWCGTRVSEGAA